MANPWKLLQGILPEDQIQVGTVVSTSADGTSQVSLPGGGVVTAIGNQFGSGQSVFMKGRTIQSLAPSPNFVLVEV